LALTILEHQPEFPEVDLTDSNAAFFENFLQNNQLVELSHPSAEANQLLFKIAHLAASQAKDSFRDDTHHAGFTHGFTMYEIISSLVAPNPYPIRDTSVIIAARQLVDALHGDALTTYLSDAYEEFRQEQAATAEVIESAAKRFHAGLTYYAVMGAAIERQFELETREYDKKIVQ
jgi:hypothetical protein